MRTRPALGASLALLLLVLGLVAAPRPAEGGEQGSWIVVAPPALEEALDPLCTARTAQGYAVVRVRPDAWRNPGRDPAGEAVRLRSHLAELVREAEGGARVLLVGAVQTEGAAAETVVPALEGTVGRMRGEPSDNGYGCPDATLVPTVAVGRFPARSAPEVREMVAKVLRFEAAPPSAWQRRITLLVGHPGGTSLLARRLAEMVVDTAVGSRFEELDPRWMTRAIVHIPASPFCVPDAKLGVLARQYLGEGQLFTIYLGHSSASGLWSNWTEFLGREDFARLDLGAQGGVFLTCGCWACQLEGGDGEGYGLAAMRNPQGPVAVIGAHGESYGAMGKLAFEGLLPLLASPTPPARLEDWWLAVKRGVGQGRIGRLVFALFDRADGSGGKVPLEIQRREHLEMWMLLGDPALRLPPAAGQIALRVEGPVGPGRTFVVEGTLPPHLAGAPAEVVLRLERPFGTLPPGSGALPKEEGEVHDDALMARHEMANDVVGVRAKVEAIDGRFSLTLRLPEPAPWKHVVLRATAPAGSETAEGALRLPVAR